jgi:hypothetical protein
VPEPTDLERDLQVFEAELRKLEAEYNMFFAGRLPRPPSQTRTRVDQLAKRLDRMYIQNYADRFRFTTLQARYAALSELWERGLRAREEGRPGPFASHAKAKSQKSPTDETPSADRILHVAAFTDPLREIDKLHELYDRLIEARRAVGDDVVPFHRFADLIKDQVRRLKRTGSDEVAFRVAVKDGKVNFTARGLRGRSS